MTEQIRRLFLSFPLISNVDVENIVNINVTTKRENTKIIYAIEKLIMELYPEVEFDFNITYEKESIDGEI